jgi:hypothetical protein
MFVPQDIAGSCEGEERDHFPLPALSVPVSVCEGGGGGGGGPPAPAPGSVLSSGGRGPSRSRHPSVAQGSPADSPARPGTGTSSFDDDEEEEEEEEESESARRSRVSTFMTRLRAQPAAVAGTGGKLAAGRKRATIVRNIHRDLVSSGGVHDVSIHDADAVAEKADNSHIMNAKPKVFIPFATQRMGNFDEEEEEDEDDEEEDEKRSKPRKPMGPAPRAAKGPFQSPGRKLSAAPRPQSAPAAGTSTAAPGGVSAEPDSAATTATTTTTPTAAAPAIDSDTLSGLQLCDAHAQRRGSAAAGGRRPSIYAPQPIARTGTHSSVCACPMYLILYIVCRILYIVCRISCIV